MSKVLPNSTRVPVAGFRAVRSADPDQIVETTLVLRRANKVSDEDVIKLASKPLADRKYVTHQQLAENPSDFEGAPGYIVPHGCHRGGSLDLHLDGAHFP